MGRVDPEEIVQARLNGPRHLWTVWPSLRRRIASAPRLALLVDFDGTLARITRLPHQARLPREARDLLGAIAGSGALVGIVSGRSLKDIRARVGLGGIWYVGTHGFSLNPPAGRPVHLATAAQKERITRAARRLKRRLRGIKGVQVERKYESVAVHYRSASPSNRARAIAAVEEVARQSLHLRILPGKALRELLPASKISKWSAVRRILGEHPARGIASRRLVIYLGDDATDEAVFEQLNGITIAVGRRQRTHAHFFLKSPGEVRKFLRRCLSAIPSNGGEKP